MSAHEISPFHISSPIPHWSVSTLTLMEAAGQGQTTRRSPGGLRGHTVRLAPSKTQAEQQQEPQGTAREQGDALVPQMTSWLTLDLALPFLNL